MEHYWRVIGIPGQLYYDPAVAAMLQKYGVTLPFEYSRKCPDCADISHVHF